VSSVHVDRATLKDRSDLLSLVQVSLHFSFVVAPVYLAAVMGPSVWTILLFFWFGLVQHGLTNLMHEAAHRHVFKRRGWNEFLGFWVLGPFFVLDFSLYRSRHWIHHQETGTHLDTKSTYLISLRGKTLRFLVRCFLGIEAARNFLLRDQQRKQIEKSTARRGPPVWLTLAVFQLTFVGSLAYISWLVAGGDWWIAAMHFSAAYGFVYLYGMGSLTILMATLRAVAEHQLEQESSASTGHAALRNLRSDPLAALLFGCYGFSCHATHHRHPGIRAYNLPRVTFELSKSDHTLARKDTYWSIIRRLTASP
jgi:fatty acid desaturase